MTSTIKAGPASAALIASFFTAYEISSLAIAETTSLANRTISEVQIRFIHDAKKGARDYSVKFKLLDDCIDIYEYITTFDTQAGLTITLNEKGKQLSQDDLDTLIRAFFNSISTHVKKIRQEESVQAITYVGNTFTLYNTTTFKVLSDTGEGHLEIEILGRGQGRGQGRDQGQGRGLQAAGMTRHALLDGLYSGAIQVLES